MDQEYWRKRRVGGKEREEEEDGEGGERREEDRRGTEGMEEENGRRGEYSIRYNNIII